MAKLLLDKPQDKKSINHSPYVLLMYLSYERTLEVFSYVLNLYVIILQMRSRLVRLMMMSLGLNPIFLRQHCPKVDIRSLPLMS